jgi:hypothetical protein
MNKLILKIIPIFLITTLSVLHLTSCNKSTPNTFTKVEVVQLPYSQRYFVSIKDVGIYYCINLLEKDKIYDASNLHTLTVQYAILEGDSIKTTFNDPAGTYIKKFGMIEFKKILK